MKKLYSKPEIVFESFSVSSNIAVEVCGIDTDIPKRDTCGIEMDGGVKAFLDGVSVCNYPITDGANGTCYHNPTDSTRLFGS